MPQAEEAAEEDHQPQLPRVPLRALGQHPCTGTVQYSTVHPCTGLQYSTVHPCTDLQCSEGVTKLLRCTVEGQGPLKLYAYACKLPQIILFVLYKKCFLIVLWNLWSNH